MAFYNEPQWAVVGDTFPVGVAYADSIVYRSDTFDQNPDLNDPRYKYIKLYRRYLYMKFDFLYLFKAPNTECIPQIAD